MYLYRRKHRILETYFKWVNDNFPDDLVKPAPIRQICKMITGKEISEKIGSCIYNMQLDGYFKWVDIKSNNQKIEATEKAISASTGQYFKVRQDQWFWKLVYDLIICISTVAIAIVTIITLNKGNGEIRQLREQLQTLQKQQEATRGEANPNKMQIEHSNQTIAKDSCE